MNRPVRSFLIVDDHAPMRRELRELLTSPLDEVHEAADGGEAEAAFEERRPDWVIMDVQMRPVGGLAATRNILARHPGAHIIIVTQFDDLELREGALESGALACLSKENLIEVRRFIHASESAPTSSRDVDAPRSGIIRRFPRPT